MKDVLAALKKIIGIYKWGILGTLVLLLLEAAFEAAVPFSLAILVDFVIGNEPTSSLGALAWLLAPFHTRESFAFLAVAVFFVGQAGSAMASYASGLMSQTMGQRVVFDYARRGFANLLNSDLGSFRLRSMGDVIYKISYDVAAYGSILESGLLPLVSNGFFVIFTSGILLWISPRLFLVASAMVPLIAAGSWYLNRHIGRAAEAAERTNSLLISVIDETLGQLKNVQAYNRQQKSGQEFDELQAQALSRELTTSGLNLMLDFALAMIIALGYATVLGYGITLVFSGAISGGLFMLFVYDLDNLTYPLYFIASAFTALREDSVRLKRLHDIVESDERQRDTGTRELTGVPVIRFDDVSVEIGESRILEHASFEIPPGALVAVVGVSGSGKSTLSSLLMRFLEPSSGRVLLDGVPIDEYTVASLRAAVAYVPQETSLFDATVEENIAFGPEPVSRERLDRAARLSLSSQFIKRLRGGYKYRVGQEGTSISGGQRQRLLIARAFLKEAAGILILDEPFSSLDIKSRQQVMANLNEFRAGKTTILISNVLDVIQKADLVVLVNLGRVVHVGTWDEFAHSPEHLDSMILQTT